jgi:hypothetical protein
MTPTIALTNALSTLLLAEEQGGLTHASKAAALGQIDRARRALQAQRVEGEPSSLAELVRQSRIPDHEPDEMFNGFA